MHKPYVTPLTLYEYPNFHLKRNTANLDHLEFFGWPVNQNLVGVGEMVRGVLSRLVLNLFLVWTSPAYPATHRSAQQLN